MSQQPSNSRRNFISKSFKGGLALSVGLGAAGSLLESFSPARPINRNVFSTGYDQQPLPYKYDALETMIDAMADGEGKISAQKEVAMAQTAMLDGKMGACAMHLSKAMHTGMMK